MIRNKYQVPFFFTNTSKSHPEISFNFPPNDVEFMTLTNKEVLLYQASNKAFMNDTLQWLIWKRNVYI